MQRFLIMVERSHHQEDVTIINVFPLKTELQNTSKQTLAGLKEDTQKPQWWLGTWTTLSQWQNGEPHSQWVHTRLEQHISQLPIIAVYNALNSTATEHPVFLSKIVQLDHTQALKQVSTKFKAPKTFTNHVKLNQILFLLLKDLCCIYLKNKDLSVSVYKSITDIMYRFWREKTPLDVWDKTTATTASWANIPKPEHEKNDVTNFCYVTVSTIKKKNTQLDLQNNLGGPNYKNVYYIVIRKTQETHFQALQKILQS